MDFTLSAYRELLSSISSCGVPIHGVQSWIENHPSSGIMIRHDVDRNPDNALAVAELESTLNICTTYYFRASPHSFDASIIRKISTLGHEIGYHYEDLSSAQGDQEQAIQSFQKNLETLRKLAPVSTIAMHGAPLSRFDNRDIWKHKRLEDYDIIGEAFLTIDYSNMYYITDTGRSWSNSSTNIRDFPKHFLAADIRTTSDLRAFICENPESRFALVMHPERWSSSPLEWLMILLKDLTVNAAKKIILTFRKNG